MGTLSADEGRYRDVVVAGTGLDPSVVTAWIACESGWGVSKPDGNYLNIGPGRSYPSVDAAAQDAVSLLSTSSNYAGIRAAAASRDGGTQVAAIIASPWDAGHYSNGCLSSAYSSLGGSTGTASAVSVISSLGDIVGGLGQALFGDPSSILAGIIDVGITIAFVIGGLALVALGVNRMTGGKAGETAQRIGTTAATAAAAA